jgi:serine/threonine-protein kinase
MKSERWQQLDQLFHSAMEREPSARAAFLDEACGGDDSLHAKVESLLAAHEEAGSFIEKPALDVEAWSVAEDQNQLSVGQTIGHYRIVSLLGAGGMGEVYLAEDTALGRKVALKLLPIDFTRDLDRVRRFQQEAHAASALNHPNIVTVYEIAHIDDRHLIATEFIDGETLRERIRGGHSEKSRTSLPIGEVLNIGIQVADALAAANEAGIVHRDIKPENIMVRRRDGYTKVLDFGLAKLTPVGVGEVDREAATRPQVKTSAGLVMGTVTYMSPEQTRGEKVDQRTDLWSLGAVLYELVAGRAPFDRPTPSEVIAAILDHDPPPLTDSVGEIPSDLDRIISKALAKERARRYQTANELLLDLRHLQQCLEVEKAVESSSSSHARLTKSTETRHQTIFNAGSRLRSMIDQKQVLIIVLVALVLLAAAIFYRSYFTTSRPIIDSIAVLPFLNVSGDQNTEYLSEGIPDALINSLTELQQLRVIRATAVRYKSKEVDPQTIGNDLKVRAVLTGRVRQMEDTLNIQVDLLDATTGAQVWGREYEGKVSDVLSVKQAIAREVTEKLRLRLSGEQQEQLTKRDTSNSQAYQFYLRGRHFWNKRTADELRKAIGEFQHAIDLDPNYALAYTGLADSYVALEAFADRPASETLPKAKAAVERALQLDDSLADAHVSRGLIQQFSWNFGDAEREYKRAVELNSNCATAYFYHAFFLNVIKGDFNEAMAQIRTAQRLDPLSPRISTEISHIRISQGELDAAQEAAKDVIELDPNFAVAHRVLGAVYLRQRRYNEAIAEFKKAVELSGRASWYLAGLGECYAMAGDSVGARAVLTELEEKYDRREAPGQPIAIVYAALGDKDQPFVWLEKDFQARSSLLPTIAYAFWNDTLRDRLSGDPRWNDLLRRIGVAQN